MKSEVFRGHAGIRLYLFRGGARIRPNVAGTHSKWWSLFVIKGPHKNTRTAIGDSHGKDDDRGSKMRDAIVELFELCV